MKNINLSLNNELYQKINAIAETFFNNNRNNAVITILEASLNSDIALEINGNLLPINKLLEIPSPSKADLSILNGVFKDTFKKNFFLLEKPLQDSLYNFLLYMQNRHFCTFGTASNISVYTPDKKLCFYINISGYRGNIAIEEYLKALSKKDEYKHLNYKVYDGKKLDFPRNTIWFSRKDQFIRNSFFDPSTSSRFFDVILNRLNVPVFYEALEISASEINILTNNI